MCGFSDKVGGRDVDGMDVACRSMDGCAGSWHRGQHVAVLTVKSHAPAFVTMLKYHKEIQELRPAGFMRAVIPVLTRTMGPRPWPDRPLGSNAWGVGDGAAE